jgi:hypothetical protein
MCVQVVCQIWWRLQLCFKPHFNLRYAQEVMDFQSAESPNFGNFGSLGTKWHLDVALMANHRKYFKGEGDGFPKSGPWWILWIYVCPWLVHAPKMFQPCINQLVVWFVQIHVNNWPFITCLNFHLGALTCPFTLEVLQTKKCTPTPSSVAFTFGLSKSVRARQHYHIFFILIISQSYKTIKKLTLNIKRKFQIYDHIYD